VSREDVYYVEGRRVRVRLVVNARVIGMLRCFEVVLIVLIKKVA